MSRLNNCFDCLQTRDGMIGEGLKISRLQMTGMAAILLLGTIIAPPVGAVPVFRTNLNNSDATGNQSGTDTPTGSSIAEFIFGPNFFGISAFGTADASGRRIFLTGRTTSASGVTIPPRGTASGFIGFDNVIFTDTNNPGATGSIDVSANFFSNLSSQITQARPAEPEPISRLNSKFSVGVGLSSLGPTSNVQNFFSEGPGFNGADFTTDILSVALNTRLSLVFSARLDFSSDINTNAIFSGALSLAANPFNLPDGFTVNSADAGIVNNGFATALGAGPDNPILPEFINDAGGFVFDFAVAAGEQFFIDPLVAIGYDFETGAGDPNFASVELPFLGDDQYDLFLFDNLDSPFDTGIDIAAGVEFDFTTELLAQFGIGTEGIAKFGIRGIEESVALDPGNPNLFVTGLSFVGSGQFTGTQTPVSVFVADSTSVPEPSALALFGIGLAGLGFMVNTRRSRRPAPRPRRRMR